MLFLALSCLQGRTMSSAARDLLSLGPVGLQLTPGCVPTLDFERRLNDYGIITRTHHGFTFDATRTDVWAGSTLIATSDSVHPPRSSAVSEDAFFAEMTTAAFNGISLETMYPGYRLGSGAEIERAMDLGVRLAVDVSHVWMQLHADVMDNATWRRIQDYSNITEVHVSANDGTRDQHRAVSANTFGLDWAIERAVGGTPIILESYMHAASPENRQLEVDLLSNAITSRTTPTVGEPSGQLS